MSSPDTPCKRNQSKSLKILKSLQEEDNNNKNNKFTERQQARVFAVWYKHMIDNERQNLALYLSDDATLEWFGKTIKSKKKITAFLKHDMHCSRHDFTTVISIDKIQNRQERLQRKEDTVLASPLNSPEVVSTKASRKRLLRSNCNSPEWAEGCQNQEKCKSTEKKRFKSAHIESMNVDTKHEKEVKINEEYNEDESSKISNKGDGVLGKRIKRKCAPVTPPIREVGQGDCLPSTSGTDSDKSHDALNAQLPKLAVECNGYIEFTRTRNSRSTDTMKWERKCKVQISYSEDPLNVGEYILWALHYTDESKCRRNLLSAFEEVAKEEETKKV